MSLLLPWCIAPSHVFPSPSNGLIDPFSCSLCLHLSNNAVSKVTNDFFSCRVEHLEAISPLLGFSEAGGTTGQTPLVLRCSCKLPDSLLHLTLLLPSRSPLLSLLCCLKSWLSKDLPLFSFPLPWISVGKLICFNAHKALSVFTQALVTSLQDYYLLTNVFAPPLWNPPSTPSPELSPDNKIPCNP